MTLRTGALVGLLLLAGCTHSGEAEVAARPSVEPECTGGKATLGDVEEHLLLTEVSPIIEVTAAAGGPLDAEKEWVGDRRAEVVALVGTVGDASRKKIYQAAVTKARTDAGPDLVELGAVYEPTDGSSLTSEGPGSVVVVEAIRAVDVDFTYACGVLLTEGTVTSWRPGGWTAVFSCDEPIDTKGEGRAIIAEAREMRC
ncbi:hypothetical protein [Actinoplanes sp. NPDC051851]|uniref:hypothetical protein n=1 Tax=Actinoplanes sp. NPDC051851 TaxID=3154753 RepID=UPI00343AA7A2